jgi:carbamoyl-phosphate synthase L subunit-like protein
MASKSLPIGIYYEHPDWFRPLFTELERRGLPYVTIDARRRRYDPSDSEWEYSLVFNRMSPSAYQRGHGQGIFYTLNYLAHLERLNIPVVNGSRAFTIETSKALQLSLLESLGLSYPRSHVINHPLEALPAARDLGFPVIVKANIGGSGAGIVRYDTPESLARAVADEKVELGIDQTALVQEFIPARGGHITRVETLNQRFLYAINVYTAGESFNLCPADICQTTDGVELNRVACPLDAPKTGLRVEAYTPPPGVIEAVENIARAAAIDVGGIEYIIDDRDGRLLYYDINALSNFVADAPRVIGFDPHARLVDYLERRAK